MFVWYGKKTQTMHCTPNVTHASKSICGFRSLLFTTYTTRMVIVTTMDL